MIFCPFTPSPTENPKNQDFKKLKKIAREIIISHLFTKNHNHMRHGSWDTGWHRQNFWSFWAIFCPFTPLTIKNLKNKNFEKMRCHHFARVYQISQSYDACFLRHGAQQTEFLFFRGQFFLPLYPNKNLKNQNFEKMKKATTTKKNTWRYHRFTLVYHKRKSCNVWFLRYGVWQTEFFVILDYFLHFYPPNPEI